MLTKFESIFIMIVMTVMAVGFCATVILSNDPVNGINIGMIMTLIFTITMVGLACHVVDKHTEQPNDTEDNIETKENEKT